MIEPYNEARAVQILAECGFSVKSLSGVDVVLLLFAEKVIRLEDENAHIRAALAMSKDPCVYCQLPAEEMAKCRQGFPGCGRADDMAGCPHFAAEMGLHVTEAEIRAIAKRIEDLFSHVQAKGIHDGLLFCYEQIKSSFPHLFKETEKS